MEAMSTRNDTELTETDTELTETETDVGINGTVVSLLNDCYAKSLLPVSLSWAVLAVIGILGNSAVLIVYGIGRHAKSKSYRPFILFLAAVDLFTCVVLIPMEITKYRFYFSAEKTCVCRIKCAFNMFALISTSFLLLAIAVDRSAAVSDPLKKFKKGAVSRKKSLLQCFILLAASIVSSVPAAILCGSSQVTLTTDLGLVDAYTCGADQRWRETLFRYFYKYCLSILQVLLSVIIIVLYCRMGYTIKRKLRRRSCRLPSASISIDDKSNKLEHSLQTPLPSNIKVLFAVTVTFVITYFLFAVLSFFSISRFSSSFPAYVFFSRVYFIQSMATPLMYAKMDRKFRYATLTLFCSRKQKRKVSSSSVNSV